MDPSIRLATALALRYRLERELGQGGMVPDLTADRTMRIGLSWAGR